MEDQFHEQIVKKDNTVKKTIAYIITIVGFLFVGFISFIYTGILLLPVVVLIAFLVYYFLLRKMNIEVEYSMVNKDFEADVIYNKEKRKFVIAVDIRLAEVIAPIGSDALRSYKVDKIFDLTSGKNCTNGYSIITSHNGQICNVKIEPDKKMLEQIKTWAGKKFVC